MLIGLRPGLDGGQTFIILGMLDLKKIIILEKNIFKGHNFFTQPLSESQAQTPRITYFNGEMSLTNLNRNNWNWKDIFY